MKKILNLILILSIALCSSLFLGACTDKDNYVPELTKTFTVNGFEIKTTSDFVLQTTSEGVKLKSEGDNLVSFGGDLFLCSI